MIKAIIFDFDGVIFDSEILHQKAWEKVFEKFEIAYSADDYLQGIGISDEDFLKQLLKEKKIFGDINDFLKEKREKLLELSTQAKPIDGIFQLIQQLHTNYMLAVASNSDKKFVMKLLEINKLVKFFSVILGYQDISKPKPDPEIYIKCARKLGVSNNECVVIEDSPAGIKAAKKAGMKCIALETTLDENNLMQADFVIKKHQINKIKELINLG
ncbi:MAG: HAD family phosphatase [Candidatus Omnitrophica bacterium]|nr:HAD family phosphatase [Candidatus Omnitrophota bacterium]